MTHFPLWIHAAAWGGFTGAALLIGAMMGYYIHLKQRVVAGIMAFGSGALISAISFELIAEAYNKGGLLSTSLGLILGAIVYSLANHRVSQYGARHRKRSNLNRRISADEIYHNALAIAIGALIDGIPESIVIGLGMVEGGKVSAVTVAAIFISNLPEGLSSSAGMKNNSKSAAFVFKTWGGIALAGPLFACIGYLFFQNVSLEIVSVIMAVAAGAILAMIVDTMIPEAFEETHDFAGFITVLGFLCAFMFDKL